MTARTPPAVAVGFALGEADGRVRTRLRQDRALSAGYLAAGFAVLGGFVFVRGLASLAWSGGRPLSIAAWVLLGIVFVLSLVVARSSGGVIPGRFSVLVPVAGVIATVLDLAAFALSDWGPLYPTATIGFGACLLACLPVQPLRRSVVGAIVLAVGGGAVVYAGWLLDPASLSAGVTGLLLGLTPAVAGITMIHVADRRLGRRIDQAVTESFVTAPALGHSITAASELRRLDGEAERLLAEVATAPEGSVIDSATAAHAERLGGELRFALLTDHEQSWLQIAVAESEHLGRTVSIVDPAALAARLRPASRRDLLAAIWLCVAAAPAGGVVLDVELVPAGPGAASSRSAAAASRSAAAASGSRSGGGADAPIDPPMVVAFSLSGTRRRPVDPAAWPVFARLGRYTVELGRDRARVVVRMG